MESIGQNIKHLRKNKSLTQEELAKKIGVNRAMIGSYEEKRAMPKLSVMQDIAHYFSISMDDLLTKKLWKKSITEPYETQISKHTKGENLRVLSTIVNQKNKELIVTVPVQAAAGYTQGYADPDYIEELPHFSLPLVELSKEKSYRVFQIKGDSMEPIKSGSYIICEYMTNWEDISDGKPYILITKDEGIVYKRIYKKIDKTGELLLKSDNPDYDSYTIDIEGVFEIWKALGFISFDLPDVNELSLNKLHHMIVDVKNEIKSLKNK